MSHPQHRQADVVLRDGSTVHVRPVRATDAPAVRAFFEHLSPKSISPKSIGLRSFSGFPTSTAPSDGPPTSTTNTATAWSPPAPTAV